MYCACVVFCEPVQEAVSMGKVMVPLVPVVAVPAGVLGSDVHEQALPSGHFHHCIGGIKLTPDGWRFVAYIDGEPASLPLL